MRIPTIVLCCKGRQFVMGRQIFSTNDRKKSTESKKGDFNRSKNKHKTLSVTDMDLIHSEQGTARMVIPCSLMCTQKVFVAGDKASLSILRRNRQTVPQRVDTLLTP